MLADYVLALLRHDGGVEDVRKLCETELIDFLRDGAPPSFALPALPARAPCRADRSQRQNPSSKPCSKPFPTNHTAQAPKSRFRHTLKPRRRKPASPRPPRGPNPRSYKTARENVRTSTRRYLAPPKMARRGQIRSAPCRGAIETAGPSNSRAAPAPSEATRALPRAADCPLMNIQLQAHRLSPRGFPVSQRPPAACWGTNPCTTAPARVDQPQKTYYSSSKAQANSSRWRSPMLPQGQNLYENDANAVTLRRGGSARGPTAPTSTAQSASLVLRRQQL